VLARFSTLPKASPAFRISRVAHLVLLVYSLAAVSGLASMGLYFFLYRLNSEPILKSYLLFLIAYSLVLAVSIVGQYYFPEWREGTVVDWQMEGWLRAFLVANLVAMAGLGWTAPRFYLRFAGVVFRPIPRRLLSGLVLASLALAPLVFAPLADWLYLIPLAASGLGVFAGIGYGLFILVKNYRRLEERLDRVGIPAIIVFNLVSFAAGVLDSAIQQGQLIRGEYPYGWLLTPLLYVFWNLVVYIWISRQYRVLLEPAAAGASESGLRPAEGAVPRPDRCQAFGLTERETEMVLLMATGLSNKEMADRLCLSLHTVRNHLHNVFAKTGVRNRVELVKLLSRSSP
jgi:DNA-binding CsgD family transcriptional regulator